MLTCLTKSNAGWHPACHPAPNCLLPWSLYWRADVTMSTHAEHAKAASTRNVCCCRHRSRSGARLVHAGHNAGEAGVEVHADPGVVGRPVVLKVVPGARVLRVSFKFRFRFRGLNCNLPILRPGERCAGWRAHISATWPQRRALQAQAAAHFSEQGSVWPAAQPGQCTQDVGDTAS